MINKIQIEDNNGELFYFGNPDEETFLFRFETIDFKTHRFYFSKHKLEFLIKEMKRINKFIIPKDEKNI